MVFHFLEWTESLLVARLSLVTRGLLEPVLLDLTETAVRHAAGVRGHREVRVSRHFPGFNIVRLWRLTAGYLKEILGDLARCRGGRHVLCYFQVQSLDEPELWSARGIHRIILLDHEQPLSCFLHSPTL